jgi:hypothetical protein
MPSRCCTKDMQVSRQSIDVYSKDSRLKKKLRSKTHRVGGAVYS